MWLNTSSIPCYLSRFSSLFHIVIPTAPRYLVDRSRMLLPSRQLLDTWWLDRASILGSNSLLLDTSVVDKHFLDTYLDSFLDTSRHLICRDLLSVLFKPPRAIRTSFHSISLSIALCFLSQTLSSHSNLNPQRFLQAFSRFSSPSKLLISHSSCISCFETQVLGFFKIVELFLKFWDRFSLK